MWTLHDDYVAGSGGVMSGMLRQRRSQRFYSPGLQPPVHWRNQTGLVLGTEFWRRVTSSTHILDLPSHLLEAIVKFASSDLASDAQSIATSCKPFHVAFRRIRATPERVACILFDRYGPLAPSCLYLKSRGQRLLRGIPGDEGANARAVLACLVSRLGGFASRKVTGQFPWLLRSATLDGHAPVVEYLLTQGGADPNAEGCRNLLSHAVESDHADILRLLIAAGADAPALGAPPLAHAARLGSETMVDMLLEAGAPVHPVTLGLACWAGNADIARKLMIRALSGAPVEDARRRLHVAILVAAGAGQAQVLGMLRGELRRLPAAAADRTWDHLEWYAVTAVAAFFGRGCLVEHLLERLWDEMAAARQLQSSGCASNGHGGSHAVAAAGGGGGRGTWAARVMTRLLRSTAEWLLVAPLAAIAPRWAILRLLVRRCPLQAAATAAAVAGLCRTCPCCTVVVGFCYVSALAHTWVPQDWPYRHHMGVLDQLMPRG